MKILIVTCFFMISTFLQAEDFYILHIKGKISIQSGIFLKIGDKITDKDKITFVDQNAVAILMSSQRGRLTLENTTKKTEKEIEFLVAHLVTPSSGTLSTRGGQDITTIIDLKNHVKGEIYPIIDTRNIGIPHQLPVTEDNYYFIAFDYQGEKIKNQLKEVDNELIIDSTIYNVNNKFISCDSITNGELYYYSGLNEQEILIEKFNPYFLNQKELKNQIESFIIINEQLNTLSNKPVEDIFKFLSEIYGNIDETWLTELYSKEFKNR